VWGISSTIIIINIDKQVDKNKLTDCKILIQLIITSPYHFS
jgi:hypothetical protein